MHEQSNEAADRGRMAEPLQRALPQFHWPGHMWICRQSSIDLRFRRVMQNVDHAGAAHAGWVVDARVREVRMVAKLLGALAREVQHVVLATEVQASRRARLDARRFQPFAHTIRAERALEHAMSLRV